MTLGLKSFLLRPLASRAQVMAAPRSLSVVNRSESSKTFDQFLELAHRDTEDAGGARTRDIPLLALPVDVEGR